MSVSHQPDTAMEANKIIVLAEGVVAEEGTYDELVSRDGGIFRRIVNAGEEWGETGLGDKLELRDNEVYGRRYSLQKFDGSRLEQIY